MTEQEKQLRQDLLNADFETRITAAVSLTENILFERNDFEESELILLDVLGFQSTKSGNIIELMLGQLYIKMSELPRAKRFLLIAQSSRDEVVMQKAKELLEFTSNSSK
jgi:hypothetical protein